MKRLIKNKLKQKKRICKTIFLCSMIITYSFLLTFGNDLRNEAIRGTKIMDKSVWNKQIKDYLLISDLSSTEENNPYPVGAVYITTDAQDPNGVLEGTWTKITGGRTLVGKSSAADFNTLKKTGGSKTITLVTDNLKAHNHTFEAKASTTDPFTDKHKHTVYYKSESKKTQSASSTSGVRAYTDNCTSTGNKTEALGEAGLHTHPVWIWNGNVVSNGSNSAIKIVNPYIVVYMWQRTA